MASLASGFGIGALQYYDLDFKYRQRIGLITTTPTSLLSPFSSVHRRFGLNDNHEFLNSRGRSCPHFPDKGLSSSILPLSNGGESGFLRFCPNSSPLSSYKVPYPHLQVSRMRNKVATSDDVETAAQDVVLKDWPKDWMQGKSAQIAFGILFASVPLVPILPRFQFSAAIYFLGLALWAVYVGSHRSLKKQQRQKLTFKQSFFVPVACSVTLFGFYCILRFFPNLDLHQFFSAYLSLIGALAVGSNLADPLEGLNPEGNAEWSRRIDFPQWLLNDDGQPVHVTVSPANVLASLIGVGASIGIQQAGAPFTLANLIAVCICTELLQLLSLGSFATAAAMLGGLLFYDVFWVFGSSHFFGDNVMVTVATSQAFDGPMKFIFPQWNASSPSPYSILGLGDVAAPGLLMALLLRFDRSRASPLPDEAQEISSNSSSSSSLSLPEGVGEESADKSYFKAALASYVFGLALTIGVNAATGAAQPALLYLVPSLLGGVFLVALLRSETSLLLNYRDDESDSSSLDITKKLPVPAKVDSKDL
eukprot:TRINITY_DN5832_c0_g2_i1.p1 TRINITY_DN5832_c0_g2~~TRINITY_DN5832_c0_g2_i1.p1  ORF type:complete len:534 (+),score=89.69 TRINITY_DN5832_c0_g2_i1:148-1749(+)